MSDYFYFKRHFSKYFILEPKILLEIDEELKSFIENEGLLLPIKYLVYREDRDPYTTSDINKVLAEPNSKGGRIIEINIQVGEKPLVFNSSDSPVFVECRFGRNGSRIKIQDYRKEKSHHYLADQLCTLFEHTQREAKLNLISVPRLLKGSLPPLVTFVLLLFLLRWYSPLQALKIGELSVIDFPLYIFAMVLMVWGSALLWKVTNLPDYLEERFRLTGIFLWGAEIQDYERRRSFRHNLTWNVLFAFLIGIAVTWIMSTIQ
ncbi:MAG: hypothetical protein KFB96_00615 [Thiocapsa sp.]|uniref:hypothetical protein n=1 Tax=Thiocapsa sp. TaxID=2024551 RepID=UPI001BD0E7D9|nr:hypothetical protein [Thiocapsa sp.]QVL49078.1 MAG: hypothetical protein KFB96_00615 [Thiocapsa sp.]